MADVVSSATKPPVDKRDGAEKHYKDWNDKLNQKTKVDPPDFEERPLEKWFKSAQVLLAQAQLQKDQGELELNYIYNLRFLDLGEQQPSLEDICFEHFCCVSCQSQPQVVGCFAQLEKAALHLSCTSYKMCLQETLFSVCDSIHATTSI